MQPLASFAKVQKTPTKGNPKNAQPNVRAGLPRSSPRQPLNLTLGLRVQTEYYEIRVLVRHPTQKVEVLSALLGDEPDYSANVGDKGHSTASFWSRVSSTHGDRYFFSEVEEVIDWLAGKGSFVHDIRQGGGEVQVIVQLPGDVNMGDTLPPDVLARAGNLGVSLGIEVFPHMKHSSNET